jgi:predicted nucleotidyltransferase
MEEQAVFDATIYRVVHGSRAYGTHRPESDYDEKGICVIGDPRYYFGFSRFEQKDSGWTDGADRQIYDIRKFVDLALRCNPNIIEVLFVDPSSVIFMDEEGERLRDNREMFLSRLAANTFVGYAMSQLHRIRGHYKWLQDPPDKPVETNFRHLHHLGIDDEVWVREFDSHVIKVWLEDEPSNLKIEHFDKAAWKTANKKFGDYIKWKRDRNPARAKLEAKYGYDAKHAMHLVRLLRMGKEILTDGKVLVRRPDAQELNDIRNGKFTYPELIEYAEHLKDEINTAEKSSPLPQKPDRQKAEKLLMGIVKRRLKW